MRVAAVLLHYELADLTRRALSGVAANRPAGLYVVDNGSASPLVEQQATVLRHAANLGVAGGWNAAVAALAGQCYDAYWLLHNDVTIAPGVLPALVAALEAHPRLGLVAASQNSPHVHMRPGQPGLRRVPFVQPGGWLLRRSAWEAAGPLDERFFGGWGLDYAYGYRLRRAGWRVGVLGDMEVHHAEHQTWPAVLGADWEARLQAESAQVLRDLFGRNWSAINTMISACTVVRNEEPRIGEALANIRPHVDEVVVVDQASSDDTVVQAQSLADLILHETAKGYCEPDRRLAAEASCGDWILIQDADEIFTGEFLAEMRRLTTGRTDAYKLRRSTYMDGRLHWANDAQVRFHRRGRVRYLPRMHTEPQPLGPVVELTYPCILHRKTTPEQIDDEERYERIVWAEYAHDPCRDAMLRLNWLTHPERGG
jgi:GT2 family glycosyltransferase